jgi:hypothetical protein
MAKARTETEQQAYELRMRGLFELLQGNANELSEIVEPEFTEKLALEVEKGSRYARGGC